MGMGSLPMKSEEKVEVEEKLEKKEKFEVEEKEGKKEGEKRSEKQDGREANKRWPPFGRSCSGTSFDHSGSDYVDLEGGKRWRRSRRDGIF